jgi:hypothetical protein
VALLTPVPTLTLTPSAPLAGMYPEVRGEGFLPNTWTRLSMDGVGTSRSWRTTTSGSFLTGPPALTKAAGTRQTLIAQQYVKGVWVESMRMQFDVASLPPPPPPPPPPVITGTALPSSIANATGNVDAQLTDWLMSLPDNATALLGSAKLTVAKQIDLQGRGPLRVEGQTSEIRCVNRTSVGIIRFAYGAHGIEWRGGAITGANPYPGRRQAETYEHNHAFDVRGVVGLDIGGVRIRNVGGDFFYLAGGYVAGGAFRHAQDIRIHDNDCQGNGRMGVAMLDGLDGFEIWNNVMGGITWYSLDIENNGHIFNNIPAGVTSGKIHNNKFGPIPYGRNPQLAPLPGISSEPSGLSFTVTGASSGGVTVPVSNIDVSFNENTDPNWPDFRWGIYASGTSGVNVHDNKNQVKR